MCVIQSSHPQCPGIKQKEGWEVRSGAATTSPSPRHSVILWARQTNRPGPRARWAQQGGTARSGYSLGQDRMGWQPLIDAAHYFHPRKLGQLQTERCHGNWGMRSQAEGFSSQLTQPRLSTQPHRSAHTCTQTHKYTHISLTNKLFWARYHNSHSI